MPLEVEVGRERKRKKRETDRQTDTLRDGEQKG